MMDGGMMGSGWGSFGLMGGLIGLLFNIAVLVGIVLLIVWAVQKVSRSTSSGASTTTPQPVLSAREVLDIRYARGELTREEYQTKLSDMTS
jgi:putative membrane protein